MADFYYIYGSLRPVGQIPMSSCYFLSFTMKTAGFSRNFVTSNIKKTKLGLKFPTCTQPRTRIPILKCFHWSRDGLVSVHFIERTLKSPFATYNLLYLLESYSPATGLFHDNSCAEFFQYALFSNNFGVKEVKSSNQWKILIHMGKVCNKYLSFPSFSCIELNV